MILHIIYPFFIWKNIVIILWWNADGTRVREIQEIAGNVTLIVSAQS